MPSLEKIVLDGVPLDIHDKRVDELPPIPGKTSELINDSGFITSSGTIDNAIRWNGATNDLATENNTAEWVACAGNDGKLQHRVIPLDYNNSPSTLNVNSASSVDWSGVNNKPTISTTTDNLISKSVVGDLGIIFGVTPALSVNINTPYAGHFFHDYVIQIPEGSRITTPIFVNVVPESGFNLLSINLLEIGTSYIQFRISAVEAGEYTMKFRYNMIGIN